jgi:hypothetical protein
MAVVHRANRKLRKEVVIPFEGEHNFIVSKYVNAAGNPTSTVVNESVATTSATPRPSTPTIPPSAGITTTPPTVVIETPSVVSTPIVSTPQPATPVGNEQGEISIAPRPSSGRPTTPAPIESPIAQPSVTTPPPSSPTVAIQTTTPVEIYQQGEIQPTGGRAPLPPPIDNPNTGTPTPQVYNASNYFPVKDYASMSCDAITSYLTELINVDSSSWDAINAARALGDYNRTLSSVRTAKDTACRVIVPPTPNVVTPTPVVTSTTTVTPPFAPVFGGGGGGGGLGEQPQDETPVVEEPKKDNSWLWILAVIGGIYFLTKKTK